MALPTVDTRVRLLKTAFVIYYHEDLSKAKQFLEDFGLHITEERDNGNEVFYRGYGIEPFCYIARQSKIGKPYFGGAAYAVDSHDELTKATKVAGASNIQPLEAPGGGEYVTLTDPAGHLVHLVFGQEEHEKESPHFEKLTVNYENEKPRVGKFQRFKPGPCPVHKWGHYGVTYPPGQYQAMMDWYTSNLALAVSDLVIRDGKPLTAFFHIDRGLEYTDHHSFFFKPAKPGQAPSVAHAAFEVHDFDVQQLGHDWLADKGYELCWGVGRHVLGSQVFDYWFVGDRSGFVVEHYADGDLVNRDTPIATMEAGPKTLAVWGPPVPEVF